MCKFIHLFLFVLLINFSYGQNQNISKKLENALIKAKEENKQVFVNYYSSNCELNDKMKNDNFKSVFNSNYIVVNINVPQKKTLEYVNCVNPAKLFSGNNCKKIEFPFWYILDDAGNHKATSFKEDNSNIGYPNTQENMNDFITIIRNTSTFTEDKLNIIKNSFMKVASN